MSHNRLAAETSPYLLQHRDNPVDWWPWGEAAFAEARVTGRPVLLSVGYAACHWCHVMAHESFEDDDTAKLMNMLFVNIKVDREERPDVDALYMAALHALGEQGGWPLTMFLAADRTPFWGGTYFPKQPAFGRPSFAHVLKEIARLYSEEPDKIAHNGSLLRKALTPAAPQGEAAPPLNDEFLRTLGEKLPAVLDAAHGGLRGAPKFPNFAVFALLWRLALRYDNAAAQAGVVRLLRALCQGGIYDHLGGGIARYTVDERWLVPHFEKMLYDNAQFLDLATEVWKETRDPLLATRIAETAGWLLREMTTPEGGFAASYDADSEGHEGKFYVWSRAEIDAVLGEADGARFAAAYDVTAEGNWEGAAILNRLAYLESDGGAEAALAPLREQLLAARAARVWPGWDDKVLADWNGLAIRGLAHAGVTFARADWLATARRAFGFVAEALGSGDRLRHSFRAGVAKVTGLASDYANMIAAALMLYQTDGDASYLAHAEHWAAAVERHHRAPEGGYYLSADDAGDLPLRTLAATDDAVPSANATMLHNLVLLATLTGNEAYRRRAALLEDAFRAEARARPIAYCGLIAGAMDALAPQEIAIAGGEAEALLAAARAVAMPGAAIHLVAPDQAATPGSAGYGKTAREGRAAAYICIGAQCSAPITEPAMLTEALRAARRA